jgi:hypothetical protein
MPSFEEKAEVLHQEKNAVHDDKSSDSEANGDCDPKEARRIRRKIDMRLIPALGAMYGISLMDRKNVSNAAIAGMTKDLRLSVGYRYRYLIVATALTTYWFDDSIA